jgi:DNA polymerase elongation subunit (family B)
MSEFYTNVIGNYKSLTYIGYRDGKKIKENVDFYPELYIPSNEPTGHIGLDGRYLTHLKKTYAEYFQFVKEYKSEISIYGNISPVYQFIHSKFGDQKGIYYDVSLLRILYLDIEVLNTEGFPSVNKAEFPISSISIKDYKSGKFYVLSLADFDKSKCELDGIKGEDINFKKMNSEIELLAAIIYIIAQLSPDAITGWNVNNFDIPYLTNRIAKILGADELKKLSPTGRVQERHFESLSKTIIHYYDFYIPIVDYIDLYKKFTYTNRESYALNYIAKVELGKEKMKYDEVDLMELWKTNPQKYIEYNIWDTELVSLLNKELGLIELALTIAYESKVLYKDVFSPVRVWDVIIYNDLKAKNIQIPPAGDSEKGLLPGGYVLDVKKGISSWIISFDLNSLYPHIVMNANISPETLLKRLPEEIENFIRQRYLKKDYDTDISRIYYFNEVIEDILSESAETKKLFELLKKYNLSMTPSLQFWRRDKLGIVGEKMELIYAERVKVRNKMFQEKDGKLVKIKSMDLKQIALKYLLNCGWGAFGNEYFRYFDIRIASSITTTGQMIVRLLKQEIEKRLNNDVYVIAGDTDSMYICMERVVKKYVEENGQKTTKELVEFIEKYNKEVLAVQIKSILNDISEKMNFIKRSLEMKREIIADKALWTAKKKYIVRKCIDDKVFLEKPKISIKGVEIVKTSTPEIVRRKLRDVVELILNEDDEALMAEIKRYKKIFEKEKPENIAFPRSISDVEKYHDEQMIYVKGKGKQGTPIHVRGALLYNHFLQELDLQNKYKKIFSGDKIKFLYLKVPNPNRNENIISFIDKLPEEFKLQQYIDYDLQFEKCFLSAVNVMTKACGVDIIKKLSDRTISIAELFFQ